jgi:hypothetical protein
LSQAAPDTHVYIPDTQVKPGDPLDHLAWVGRYIAESYGGRRNVTIIHAGDHAHMNSLSLYDRGKREAEGRRFEDDINAANEGFDVLQSSLKESSPRRWNPDRYITLGNHEDRITRAANDHAWLDGTVSLDRLNYARNGWDVIPFKEVLWLSGIAYSHLFYNPDNGRPFGGQIDTRLKNIGHSFTQGHQQGLRYGLRPILSGMQHGLVAGSCYPWSEDYRGPQARGEWRGIVVKHQCENGSYDPMFVSLDYLCRRNTGKRLAEWLQEREGVAA